MKKLFITFLIVANCSMCFVKALAQQSNSSKNVPTTIAIKEYLRLLEWKIPESEIDKLLAVGKQRKEVLIATFSDGNKEIKFVGIPAKGGQLDEGYIGHVSGYKGGFYSFVLRPTSLSSVPPAFQGYFHYFNDIPITRDCSPNINLDKGCVREVFIQGVVDATNERFDAVLFSGQPYFKEELKNEVLIVKKEFNKMPHSLDTQEVYIMFFESEFGMLKVATDLDYKILGILAFSPTVY